MDQSVAIQETLAEGEYCLIISCLALASGMTGVRTCVSACLPLSVPWGRGGGGGGGEAACREKETSTFFFF